MERYWITVVSKDHLAKGVAGGFMQANHGKATSLKKMHKGDWVIFYSPKVSFKGNEFCQAFTAIGKVADDEIYTHRMTADFVPHRRNIQFCECEETPIAPLINELFFMPNKFSWGFPFRFGFFEIHEPDFNLIKSNMIKADIMEIKQ
jgi:hypothetical protein